MKRKVIFKSILLFVILITLAMDGASQDPPSPIRIPTAPIVIKSVAQHYENPTLEQYNECTKRRDKCTERCHGDRQCEEKCPVCPILIDQDVLVQGINDTLYRLPITTYKVNQTNIVKLTNEIRNIIRTSLGNITTHSQNNITIYRKVSKTGGKFGLGYNERGSCCHTIEPERCRRTPNGPVCTPRHQQTCGPHCISRVMRAKRVVTCSELNPEECTQSIEYLPQLRRPGCVYTSKWPFIHCGSRTQHGAYRRRSTCAQCYDIPYMNVIRGQLPRSCLGCFRQPVNHRPAVTVHPYYNNYGQQYPAVSYQSQIPYQPYPAMPHTPMYDYSSGNNWALDGDDSFDIPTYLDNDFKVEEQKCLNEDGTTIENCTEDESPYRLPLDTNGDENDDHGTTNDSDYDFNDGDMAKRTVVRVRRQN